MKATFKSKYRKAGTGNLVFVYTVTGTAKEIAAYEQAQGDKLVKDEETGAPLYYFVPNVRSGRIAEKQFTLVVSHGGKVVLDDTAKEMNEQAEDRLMFRQERAKLWAQQDVAGQRNVTSIATISTATTEPKDEVFNEELNVLQGEGAGTGTLAD